MNAKNKIVEVAQKIILGELNIIEGSRIITSLVANNNLSKVELYFPFEAVDSETDHLPFGQVRDECSSAYLARIDREIEAYIKETKSVIIEACKVLIEKLEIICPMCDSQGYVLKAKVKKTGEILWICDECDAL